MQNLTGSGQSWRSKTPEHQIPSEDTTPAGTDGPTKMQEEERISSEESNGKISDEPDINEDDSEVSDIPDEQEGAREKRKDEKRDRLQAVQCDERTANITKRNRSIRYDTVVISNERTMNIRTIFSSSKYQPSILNANKHKYTRYVSFAEA